MISRLQLYQRRDKKPEWATVCRIGHRQTVEAFASRVFEGGELSVNINHMQDKCKWRAQHGQRTTKACEYVSQLTGQDGRINCAGFSSTWSAPKARMLPDCSHWNSW